MAKVRALLVTAGCVIYAGSALFSAAGATELSSTRAAWGTLKGSVTLGHAPANASAVDDLRNAVVYLEHVDSSAEPAATLLLPARMTQEGQRLHPRVQPVVKGSSVEFVNRNQVFHDVVSLPKSASLDLGRPAKNGSKTLKFETPGVFKVVCRVHSDMSGVIVVLQNPFYAQPGYDGRFIIDGIPPGDYRVVVWHERARLVAKPMHIDAGKASILNFDLSLTGPAGG